MLKVFIRIRHTAGINHICDTHCRCISKRCSCVKFIISFQITFCNDVEELLTVFLPVIIGELSGNPINLRIQCVSQCRNTKCFFQSFLHRWYIFILHFPQINRTGVSSGSGVRNIKNIFESRLVSAVIQQCDTFRTTFYIAIHFVIPKVIFRTSRSIRSLCMNHQLLMVRIFIKTTGSCQKRSPSLPASSDLTGGIFRHSCIIRCLRCHQHPPIFI